MKQWTACWRRRTKISNVSAVGGRVQAFYSKLATLNAVRRDTGGVEVPYKLSMAQAKVIATDFDALVVVFSDDIDVH